LSQDEIVFDEVQYREPERICRPDRDRRYACLAYELPGPEDLPIFLDRRTADAIERHALRDTSVELGGILLGKECIDSQTGAPFVLVTESLEAKHYENTQASFTYTHDSWEEITRERDRLHPGLDIVGWYHTHPDFGVFLSSHDIFIQQHFFAQPLQVAYVVDPIRQDRGFFQWRSGTLAQVGGFFLVAGRGERQLLARLVNDLESIPNTDGGGGGLSPRLEAELLAMLTRT
jgi:proteasome lid subunit RPN8/RPN11